MSYSEYRVLCEKAYTCMIDAASVLVGRKSDEGYFVDCMVLTNDQHTRYNTKGLRILSHDEIMEDCGAQEELLTFGLRDAWDREHDRLIEDAARPGCEGQED
jgi:hypothetical protein